MTAHDWVHVCLFIDTLLYFSPSLSVSHPRFFLAPAACGQIDEGRSLCDARPSMRPRGRGEADPPGDAGVAGTIVFFLTCLPASQPAASRLRLCKFLKCVDSYALSAWEEEGPPIVWRRVVVDSPCETQAARPTRLGQRFGQVYHDSRWIRLPASGRLVRRRR
ncbi:hypothetical protein EV126DRAFT_416060 [Verticillium dahliae]|nr:hypothetical protein EV126DRAFT_416060 [Verticillium dahliae]